MRLEHEKQCWKSPWAHVAVTMHGKPLGGIWAEPGVQSALRSERVKSGWTVHKLRHFVVTELFRNGVPAPLVQRLARHSDLVTTQRYADVDTKDVGGAAARLDGTRAEALGQGTKY